jgi:hypothetical protein
MVGFLLVFALTIKSMHQGLGHFQSLADDSQIERFSILWIDRL